MSVARFTLGGARLVADPAGALLWPAQRLLAVADLHLEKGSGHAARGGGLLPPYDSRATLERLAALLRRYRPRTVLCLGDSLDDGDAHHRLDAADAARLARMAAGRDWIWIAGNHDPAPPPGLGGRVAAALRLGPLVFRHEAATGGPMASGEVSGHFHPKAAINLRARRFTGKCFVTDGRRLILPAFGAYTGGLDVRDPAIDGLLEGNYRVYVAGQDRIYSFTRGQLRAPLKALSGDGLNAA